MKVLITGAHGQVGSSVTEKFSLQDGNEVFSLSHNDLDITSRDDVMRVADEIAPDVIVNAAAMTNVDACETDVDRAFAINALAVRYLAQAAELHKAHLVQISTDFVFDGNSMRPYSEYDTVNPLSVYAQSKYGGDVEALRYDKASVVRVAWVFGNRKGDFFTWVANGVKDGAITGLISDQIGTPTYSYDIADIVETFVSRRIFGLVNVANAEQTTRLEMGQVLCDSLGLNVQLAEVAAASLGRPAPRPNYSALSTATLTSLTGIEMRSWKDALTDHIAHVSAV